jgi:plastocyanin
MSWRTRLIGVGVTAALMGAACSPSQPAEPRAVELGRPAGTSSDPVQTVADDGGGATGPARRVDPRQGGFEVGFGEYAVTLEAPAIRPGRVTFVVHNGGKLVHGFEIENESEEGDSSGSGSGEDGYKAETDTIQPGATISFELDLRPGIHKVECFIDGHDDLGMEILLEVRPDAPKVRQETASGSGGDAVSIAGFAYEPADLQVAAGTEVTWTNDDPTPHTVTADRGEFDSEILDPGATFSVAVDGSVTYFCEIHPTMKGRITVD